MEVQARSLGRSFTPDDACFSLRTTRAVHPGRKALYVRTTRTFYPGRECLYPHTAFASASAATSAPLVASFIGGAG
jgi:hypothetical protein